LRGEIRLGSTSGVAASGAFGRPEIGGSGSPAPITARADAFGWGAPDVADAAGPAPSLPDRNRSGIAESGLAESGFDELGLDRSFGNSSLNESLAGSLPEPDAFAESAAAAPGRMAASGGGCGGRPAATRCREGSDRTCCDAIANLSSGGF